MSDISTPKTLKQSRVQTAVTFTEEERLKAEEKAVERLGERIRIEGFRPGRAPAELLRKKIDPSALQDETIRTLLPDVFDRIIKEHQVKPIIPPKVELTSKSPMTLTLTFVGRPEVKVKGADKIRIAKKDVKIERKDTDRMVEYLKNQYRTTKPVDRPAAMGDELTVDFVGNADGKEMEGTRATGYKLHLGSKSFIPGFEEALVGMKKGEQKTFNVTFPADYHAEHLKGKPVDFSTTVHDIHEVNIPEFTDAFVQEHHLGASLDELHTRIGETLREQEEQSDRGRREKELFDAIREATSINLAPELIEHEERGVAEEIGRNLEREQTSFDDWLKQTNRTPEALQKELREEATKRLTLRFAIQWLMEEKKIDVTPEEIATTVAQMLATVPPNEKKNAEEYYKEGSDGYEELKWRKRVEKLVEMMLAA